jgi:uncharacterized protein
MPDVNVLLAAHFAAHPHHDAALAALTRLTASPFCLSLLTLGGFVRIATHRAAFDPPGSLPDALAVVRELARHPNATVIGPGVRHLDLFAEVCEATGATGKLVADAQHAAIAIEFACRWVTFDRDFERFRGFGLQLLLLGGARDR